MKNLHEIGVDHKPWHLQCMTCWRWLEFTPTSIGAKYIPQVEHLVELGGSFAHYLSFYVPPDEYIITAQQFFT